MQYLNNKYALTLCESVQNFQQPVASPLQSFQRSWEQGKKKHESIEVEEEIKHEREKNEKQVEIRIGGNFKVCTFGKQKILPR